jgi:hypothetical protein
VLGLFVDKIVSCGGKGIVMAMKTFRLIGFDEGGVKKGGEKNNLRLVCLIEGGGKLAIWGSATSRVNIDLVQQAGMPCNVECDCIPPQEWAARYGHTDWVPEGKTLRVLAR